MFKNELKQIFLVYRPYKEWISKDVNNDNDLNLHLHDQKSGWLRYRLYDNSTSYNSIYDS